MAEKAYVAGVLDALETLEHFIGEVIPEVLAEEFLRSTLLDVPRPPWRTGALRRSGVVYIGGSLYMDTTEIAQKYGAMDQIGENPVITQQTGIGQGLTDNGFYDAPKTLKLSKVKYKGTGSTGSVSSLRGKVTVLYQAPHAALMHEWPGGFSDMHSGAHYVSSKALMATKNAAFRIKHIAAERGMA